MYVYSHLFLIIYHLFKWVHMQMYIILVPLIYIHAAIELSFLPL